ncbi:MAG: ceramidase domain-containing protein, partial [Hyphomicrobiales bacterium]
MNWLEPIDAYCERIDASLLGEPLNALSNAAFFAAAIWAAAAARRTRSGGAVWALIVLVALIGAGSLAFHVFANRWSVLADVIPISVFIYAYLAFALRRFLVMNWPETAMSLVALFAATLLVERATPPGF